MLNNIKQKFLKLTLSFLCLVFISGCEHTTNFTSRQKIVDVAILLPISGPESEINKEYAEMIKIGLSDSAKAKIRATTYDITTEQKLEESLEKIKESGTKIIVGPTDSSTTKIIANKVKDTDTYILSLSNDPVLADKNVFVYGHAPMRQLEKLTDHFLSQGYKNYIILLPSTRYSHLASTILRDMIESKDGVIDAIELYSKSPKDIKKSVRKISNNVDSLNENAFNLKQPVIFIADNSTSLQILYQNIQKYNLDKKAIIAGDSKIDTDFTPPIDITFTGSMMINNNTTLKERSLSNGIKHISFMHAIAYDIGKMTGENIGTNYNKTNFLNKMNSTEFFPGISGNIHFIESIAKREYEIIEKKKGEYNSLEKPISNSAEIENKDLKSTTTI